MATEAGARAHGARLSALPPRAAAAAKRARSRITRQASRGAVRRFRREVADSDDARLARLDGRRGRLAVGALFAAMPFAFNRRAARGLEAAIEFRVTEPDGGATLHTLLIADGGCRVRHGVVAEPDLTIELSAADLFRIAAGVVDGVTLAMDSRLRVSGDLALAFRLPRLFRPGRRRPRQRTAENDA